MDGNGDLKHLEKSSIFKKSLFISRQLLEFKTSPAAWIRTRPYPNLLNSDRILHHRAFPKLSLHNPNSSAMPENRWWWMQLKQNPSDENEIQSTPTVKFVCWMIRNLEDKKNQILFVSFSKLLASVYKFFRSYAALKIDRDQKLVTLLIYIKNFKKYIGIN